MKKFTYVIKDKEGVHARPAGAVVGEAKKHAGAITIANKGRSADLKRIFGVMGLCIKFGETVEVTIDGGDEEAAFQGLKKAFEEHL